MHDTLSINFAQPIALFPLPNCVLLPHATIPLHIFEPRYRHMISDALAADKLIAMALFEGDDWKVNYQGKPPLRPHVCVGYIARYERLADGRYNLLLQGVCRARIGYEMSHEPYRCAMLEPTEDRSVLEIDLSQQREQIEKLLREPLMKNLSAISAIHNWLSAEVPTNALIDLAAITACDHLEQRYQMLEEADPAVRARRLIDHLQGLHHTLRLAQRYDPPIDHGLGPN